MINNNNNNNNRFFRPFCLYSKWLNNANSKSKSKKKKKKIVQRSCKIVQVVQKPEHYNNDKQQTTMIIFGG